MKKIVFTFVVLTAAVAIAACTSSTTNNSTTTQELNATLNAHFATHYRLIQNFTRSSQMNETPVYTGIIQEANGTQRFVTIIIPNSTSEAQKTFDEQKAGLPTALNATFKTNNSTHFEIANKNASISGWVVQPKTIGPFGLSLDTVYVLVSQQVQEMQLTTNETTAVVTTG